MSQINIQYHNSKIGELIVGTFEGKLCLLDFRYRKMRNTVDIRLQTRLNAHFVEREDDIIQHAIQQTDEFLTGERQAFNLPLLMAGTEFQQQVWRALMTIPYGQTSTYLELAKIINNEKAVRAVASANGANAIALIIPCHRIIGSDGQLVGYGGGLSVKKALLKLEISGQNNMDNLDENVQAQFEF